VALKIFFQNLAGAIEVKRFGALISPGDDFRVGLGSPRGAEGGKCQKKHASHCPRRGFLSVASPGSEKPLIQKPSNQLSDSTHPILANGKNKGCQLILQQSKHCRDLNQHTERAAYS
jgi:hypothetical protein